MMDYFNTQMSAAERLEILGPSKFEAWMRGDISIRDLVGWRDDGNWGISIYEKSLKEIGLDAQDYLASARLTADADVFPYRFNLETRRYERIVEELPLPPDIGEVPYRLDLNTGQWERIPEEELPGGAPTVGEKPTIVTRSGTYPDGRAWEVRDYKGPTPPPDTETSAFDGLGSDEGMRGAGEHWTPQWEYRSGTDDWIDRNPRWDTPPGVPNNLQCLNCDRIFGGPLEDRKSTRLNSSHTVISYAVFCFK